MNKLYVFFVLFLFIFIHAEDTINILFAGDTFLGWGAEYIYLQRAYSRDSMDFLYDLPGLHLNNKINYDYFIVNLETSITNNEKKIDKQFNFKMRPSFTRMLELLGINAVSLANNHTMDFGDTGIINTENNLKKSHIRFFGAGKDVEDAFKPIIVSIKDTKIMIMGASIIGPEGIFAGKDKYGTAGSYNLNTIIKYAEKEYNIYRDSVDICIAFLHWGKENSDSLTYAQKFLSHKLIDIGYDAIIGAHPHIVQGIEEYKGKYIFYSLGNFIFGGNDFKPEWSILLNLHIVNKNTVSYGIIPIYLYPRKTQYSPYIGDKELEYKTLNYIHEFNTKNGID